MSNYPAYGTHPIACGKSRCSWRGYETQLAKKPLGESGFMQQSVCPTCGCDSYTFLTPRQIAIWKNKKAKTKAKTKARK